MNNSQKSPEVNSLISLLHFSTFLLLLILTSCNNSNKDSSSFYSTEDFSKVKKIDCHAHIYTTDSSCIVQAKEDNVVLISVNVEVPGETPIDSQQFFAIHLQKKFPATIFYLTTFETTTINQPGWQEQQLSYLKKSFDNGAVGIKVWKNIGMTLRDRDSNFIMIDNPIFDPILNYLEQNEMPVLGHLGEPKNCWLPLDQMTTINDRNYFKNHPEYHMFIHPEYPSYDDQIQARDRMLERHPNLKFMGGAPCKFRMGCGKNCQVS